MSRIFAGGVEATAISNITTDLAGYISFDAQGIKRLDVEGLIGYLETSFAAISTDAEYIAPATAASSAAAARNVSTRALVDSLNATIREENWNRRPDWPTTTKVLQGGTLVAAVADAIAACGRASDELYNYHQGVAAKLGQVLTDFYYREGIDKLVPEGVQRFVEDVFYRFTWVTDRGEESAPSAVSARLQVDQNDTKAITIPAVPSGRSISHFRLYRSAVGNDSLAWRMVPHASDSNGWPVSGLTITDDRKESQLSDQLQTQGWSEPPADLVDILAGPNDMLVGHTFEKNEVWFSVNGLTKAPYAWPARYRKTTGWPIVAKGTFGNTVVVLTRGKPYFAQGTDSSAMDFQPVESDQTCVSARSVTSIPPRQGFAGGVGFASQDGYCVADGGAVVRVITGPDGFNLWDKDGWQALNPSSMVCAVQDNVLIIQYNNGAAGCYHLDLVSGNLTTSDLVASAFYRDLLTDTLYYSTGTAIKSFATSASKRTATWKSPIEVNPRFIGYTWVQADSNYEATVTVKAYAAGTLNSTTVLDSRAAVKGIVPADEREWEVQVESAARVTSVTLATTAQELRAL
ncbi:hypothetical protein [Ramlibacter sp.]|uniref:hypothetical protein n=1 Tax=Ramlibacter sp. TaxID=1917967 RepID=UPI003D09E56F